MKLDQKNETKSMMKSNYQDHKLNKSNELNNSMTINEGSRDSYESALHNIGGTENNG